VVTVKAAERIVERFSQPGRRAAPVFSQQTLRRKFHGVSRVRDQDQEQAIQHPEGGSQKATVVVLIMSVSVI